MNVKISLKIPQLKIISYLVILALFVLSIFLSWKFLHDNFYLTIGQSQGIANPPKNITKETIDIKIFENVIKKIEDKTSGQENVSEIKNPFD
jgi:hypothetical protein